MHLEPLFIKVLPRLSKIGSTDQAQGVLDVRSIAIGHRKFEVPDGIAYEANLLNTGEAVLLSGVASASLETTCDRCLEPANIPLTGEIQGYFLLDKTSAAGGKSSEEHERVDDDGRIDLAPPILAAIVFELPTVNLCEADCAGISAPASASSAPCTSTTSENNIHSEVEKPPSPFAGLKDFKFED